MINFIFNYIYSVLRRSEDFKFRGNFFKLTFVFIFSYCISAVVGLLSLEPVIFESPNDGYRIFVISFGSFLLVYPFFRILIPGYVYIDRVQQYSIEKAILISGILGLLPIVILWALFKFFDL